jgi:predicted metal-dependent hydrolase
MIKNRISYATLLVNDVEFPYQIRFSKKAKYLQLRINHSNSLELVIPKRYSLKDGEKFINDKIDWIKKYSGKLTQKDEKYFFLGEEIKILQIYDLFVKRPQIKFVKKVLRIKIPNGSNYELNELYLAFLKRQTKKYLIERVNYLANKFNLNVSKISIRGQKTRWGSCSSSGKLSFNFKLMKFRKDVIDYVIIHELCHLKEMNHSKKFWKLVESYCPNYKTLRRELKS